MYLGNWVLPTIILLCRWHCHAILVSFLSASSLSFFSLVRRERASGAEERGRQPERKDESVSFFYSRDDALVPRGSQAGTLTPSHARTPARSRRSNEKNEGLLTVGVYE